MLYTKDCWISYNSCNESMHNVILRIAEYHITAVMSQYNTMDW